MKRELVAYVSLGFGCGGPEMGDYGKVVVDLTPDEWKKVDEVANDPTTHGWKRSTLIERYPEIDEKICEAGQDLVERISLKDIIENDRQWVDCNYLIKGDIEAGLFKYDGPLQPEVNDDYIKDWEKWELDWILNKPSEERFKLVKGRYGLVEEATLEDICGTLCYYLTEKEIPEDYKN